MTEESRYLLDLARRIAEPYSDQLFARATMVTGSVAEGRADAYSDIDLTAYYDAIPSEANLARARAGNRGSERVWTLGDRDAGWFAEAYRVNGVEVQIGHTAISQWEKTLDSVLVDLDLDLEGPNQKALSGTLICIPFRGRDLIDSWKERIRDYPPELGVAMVEHHLRIFPIWGLVGVIGVRDAMLWRYEIMVESAQHLLGVLAGLNRRYFATFQFKQMRTFLDTLTIVNEHLPGIDTGGVARRLDWRAEPWKRADGAPAAPGTKPEDGR